MSFEIIQDEESGQNRKLVAGTIVFIVVMAFIASALVAAARAPARQSPTAAVGTKRH